jgi:chitodextrinase
MRSVSGLIVVQDALCKDEQVAAAQPLLNSTIAMGDGAYYPGWQLWLVWQPSWLQSSTQQRQHC